MCVRACVRVFGLLLCSFPPFQVVMAFWQAMGGDGDELEGIDSDDQE